MQCRSSSEIGPTHYPKPSSVNAPQRAPPPAKGPKANQPLPGACLKEGAEASRCAVGLALAGLFSGSAAIFISVDALALALGVAALVALLAAAFVANLARQIRAKEPIYMPYPPGAPAPCAPEIPRAPAPASPRFLVPPSQKKARPAADALPASLPGPETEEPPPNLPPLGVHPDRLAFWAHMQKREIEKARKAWQENPA